MKRQFLAVLRVSAMLSVLAPAAVALAGDGPPKPSGPKKCSVAVVGDAAGGAAGGALMLALGIGLAAARRRGRR